MLPIDETELDPAEVARIRRLKRIVIGLGVAILLCLVLLAVGIVTRLGGEGRSRSVPPMAYEIDLPADARLVSMSVEQGRVYILYETAMGGVLDVREASSWKRVSLVTLKRGP